jgi:Reverse transcriptase (RNA-dependent DNA polymerase)
MGVTKCATDIAQEVMTALFCDLDEVSVFIDDLGIFNNSFEAHLQTIDIVLNQLQSHNFCVNPLKCEWCVQETDYLGYWMTPSGLKPWRKKLSSARCLLRQLLSFDHFLGLWYTTETCFHIPHIFWLP